MPDNNFFITSSLKQREAWNTRYRLKGRQWGNAPVKFPVTHDSGVILELGVGDGKNIRARSDSECFIIGVDFSLEALHLCREDPVLSEIQFLLGHVCHLPIRDCSVNTVFANHILGHLSTEDTRVLFAEVFRVLNPGDLFVLTVFAKGDMRDNTGVLVEPSTYLRGDGIMTRYYSEENIRTLSHNFIITEMKRIEWSMRIRGRDYIRAVISAILRKP